MKKINCESLFLKQQYMTFRIEKKMIILTKNDDKLITKTRELLKLVAEEYYISINIVCKYLLDF